MLNRKTVNALERRMGNLSQTKIMAALAGGGMLGGPVNVHVYSQARFEGSISARDRAEIRRMIRQETSEIFMAGFRR